MTAGAAIVTIRLLAGLYAVDAQMMDCIVARESDYAIGAVNGVHVGLAQFRPDTWDWMVGMALADPTFAHAGVVRADPRRENAVASLAMLAWAIRDGRGAHWSTWTMCGGEG